MFIFAPDDSLKIRKQQYMSVRDNVVFELGLFIGRLGKERGFIVAPRGQSDLRLPSDLIGVTPGTYDAHRKDKNLAAALGPVCSKLKRAFKKIGVVKKKLPRRSSSQPVLNGLAQELKTELLRAISQRDSKIDKVLTKFGKNFTTVFQDQHRIENASDPESYVAGIISRKLSPIARSFIKAVSRRHLTTEQYRVLNKEAPFRAVIRELRGHGFLVPLVGFDDQRNKIPVYWFPPELSKSIRSVISSYTPDSASWKTVDAAFRRINYH